MSEKIEELKKKGLGMLMGQEYEKSIEVLSKAIELSKESGEKIDNELYHLRGNCYLQLGKLEDSKPNFEESLKLNAKYYKSISNLGFIHFENREFEEALKKFREAWALCEEDNPHDLVKASLKFNLGNAFRGKGEHELAVEEYSESLKYNPENVNGYIFRSQCYMNLKKYEESANDSTWIVSSPNSSVGQKKSAFLNIGNCNIGQKYFQPAVDAFSRAIALEEDADVSKHDHEPYFQRAVVYVGMEKTDEAIEDFTKVILIKPKNQTAHYNRGQLHVRKNMTEEALKDFERCCQLSPFDEFALLNFGKCLMDLKRDDAKVLEIFEKVLMVNSQNQRCLNWKKELEERMKKREKEEKDDEEEGEDEK